MKRLSLLIPLLALLVTTASAQQTVTLTMEEAVATAISNNRDLASARLAIKNSDQQVKEAWSNTLPSVGLNASYTRNLQKQVFFFPGQDGITRPIEVGSDNALSADITATQIVFNSAVLTGAETSETYAKISRQQLRTKTSEVVLNVKRAYYSALLARDVLQVNQALLANSEENYRNTAALAKSGVRAEFDAIRAQVQVDNQRPVVVQARDNYQAAIDNLKVVLGYDDTKQIELSESLARPASLTQVEPSVAEAKTILEQQNPTVQSLRLMSEVNRQMIEIKKSDYLPTVTLIGRFQLQTQFDGFDEFDLQPTSFVGLNLGMNLYNGNKTTAQVEQANITAQQSVLQLNQVTAALKMQLETTLRRINYARERITSTDKTIELAGRGYKIATASYKAGTGTQLQINDADLALAQAKLNQLSASYDYYMAMAELEQLLGQRYEVTQDNNDVKYSVR